MEWLLHSSVPSFNSSELSHFLFHHFCFDDIIVSIKLLGSLKKCRCEIGQTKHECEAIWRPELLITLARKRILPCENHSVPVLWPLILKRVQGSDRSQSHPGAVFSPLGESGILHSM